MLKTGTATSPDSINSCVLKEIVHDISRPFKIFFLIITAYRLSGDIMETCSFCAVYKKADAEEVRHYLLISLLSGVSIVMEIILYKYLFYF